MMYLYPPFPSDPFADDNEGSGSQDGYIHIRIQQRNGRKTLTTVQGIRTDYDLKKIVKACKKVSSSCESCLFFVTIFMSIITEVILRIDLLCYFYEYTIILKQ